MEESRVFTGCFWMKRFDTVIFDLDGTLLDTLGDLRTAADHALGGNGGSVSEEQVRLCINNGVLQLLKNLMELTDRRCDPNEALCRFKEKYAKCFLDKTAAYDGIPELLLKLRSDGYKVGVFSNKLDSFVQRLCAEKLPSGTITAARGEVDGVPRKPSPDGAFLLMKQLGVEDVSRVIYVGDSDTDVATAKNAGFYCAAVSWGYRGREFLLKADIIADSAQELYRIISGEV